MDVTVMLTTMTVGDYCVVSGSPLSSPSFVLTPPMSNAYSELTPD